MTLEAQSMIPLMKASYLRGSRHFFLQHCTCVVVGGLPLPCLTVQDCSEIPRTPPSDMFVVSESTISCSMLIWLNGMLRLVK